MIYDVIIIGAGPAGSIAADKLSEYGLKVLIIEKEALPRQKTCAGGVPLHTLQTIKIDDDLIKQKVNNVKFIFKKKHINYSLKSYIGMVDRKEFDYYLITRAHKKGASVRHEEIVISVSAGLRLVTVKTNKEEYKSKFLIGADGALSIVRRNIFPDKEKEILKNIGWATNINIKNRSLNAAVMEIGKVKQGYGWIFPKENMISCGVGTALNRFKYLKRETISFIKRMGINKFNINEIVGAPLGFLNNDIIPDISGNRTILIGDAALLVDPLSGEGIYSAIKSGIEASKIIKKEFESIDPDFNQYNNTIINEFYNQYNYAKILAYYLFKYPKLAYTFGMKDKEIVSGFEELLSGDITYSELIKKMRKIVAQKISFKILYSIYKNLERFNK